MTSDERYPATQERISPTADIGRRRVDTTSHQLNVFAPQHPQNGLLLARRCLSATSGRSRICCDM